MQNLEKKYENRDFFSNWAFCIFETIFSRDFACESYLWAIGEAIFGQPKYFLASFYNLYIVEKIS